jgi:transcriptional regulator
MYNIPYFKETDKNVLIQFLHDHPFAFLTGSYASGKQVATQLPLLFEERDGMLFLQGHIMRNTDHHKAFMENPQGLAVFTGASAYVSASWYTQPSMGSTWNYMSVHAGGMIEFMSEERLIHLMRKFTLKFENNDTSSPTIYDNLSENYVKQMLPAIVGFEMKVEKLDNVFKLSQNRDEESYLNIIRQLEKQGGNAALIATEMKNRMSALFPKDVH